MHHNTVEVRQISRRPDIQHTEYTHILIEHNRPLDLDDRKESNALCLHGTLWSGMLQNEWSYVDEIGHVLFYFAHNKITFVLRVAVVHVSCIFSTLIFYLVRRVNIVKCVCVCVCKMHSVQSI